MPGLDCTLLECASDQVEDSGYDSDGALRRAQPRYLGEDGDSSTYQALLVWRQGRPTVRSGTTSSLERELIKT